MGSEKRELFVGRDYIADRGFAAEPVYVADLDQCTPAGALSRESKRGHWKMYDYETHGFNGVVLMAGPETEAPDITYPLNVTGWHAVSIGIHPTQGEQGDPQVLARLTGDDTFSSLTWQTPDLTDLHQSKQRLEEMFWQVADLTGQQIVFRQATRRLMPGDAPGAVECAAARLAYVKLVPLSDAEVQALQADRNDPANRRLSTHNDSFSIFTTAEAIRRQVEAHRDTDFSHMFWEIGSGDLLHYPSKVARTWGDVPHPEDYARVSDRMRDESWSILRDKGIDPFQVAVDYTHEIGLEFHAAYRLAGWTYPLTGGRGYEFAGGFYDQPPEWHCIGREGRNVPRMSYAYREVQDFVLSVLREVATKYDIEGISLLYNRRPPYVDHEQPLIDGFKAAHGEDPRRLEEDDPTWLAYRAGVMTEFMRRVRSEMDGVSREQGRRVEVSACVLGNEEENLYFGLDIPAWAKEGLVDTVIPYSPAPLAMPVETDTWSSPEQVKPFVDATRGTSCRLVVNVMPRQMSPEDFRRMASMLYGAGVEHMFFWDGRANYRASWNAVKRLGHKDEIEGWMQAGEPDLSNPLVRLRTLGGWNMEAIAPG